MIVSKQSSGDYEINTNLQNHRPVSREKSSKLTSSNPNEANTRGTQQYIKPNDLLQSSPPRPIGRKPPPPTDLPPENSTKMNRPAPPPTISPPSQVMISPPKEAPPPSMMRRPMIRPPGGMAPPALRRPNAPSAPNPALLNQLEHKED